MSSTDLSKVPFFARGVSFSRIASIVATAEGRGEGYVLTMKKREMMTMRAR
jgi:hypothetical protein